MTPDERTALDRVTLQAAMEEVTSGLAHELNQPLSAISLYARGTIRRLEGGAPLSPEDLAETLENISQQAQRAGRIIRDARARTRVHTVIREEVDTAAFLRDSCAHWMELAAEHSVPFQCQHPAQLPGLRIDPAQIRHAIGHLLRNALEAVAESAEAGSGVDMRVHGTESGLEIRIANATTLDAPLDLEQWFAPFHTTKKGHFGLGLGVSRNLIRLHGGSLLGQLTDDGTLEWVLILPTDDQKEAP